MECVIISKRRFYCLLDFCQNLVSTASLVVTTYKLPYSFGKSWFWEDTTIISLVLMTVLFTAIKNSLNTYDLSGLQREHDQHEGFRQNLEGRGGCVISP